MATSRPGVIYILRDRFQIYSPGIASILELRFPAEVVKELDVIDKEKLEVLIKTFISNSKIPPGDLIFVISDNAAFIKDLAMPAQQAKGATPVTEEQIYDEGEKFIDHTPFESVVSKIFPMKNGIRVFVVNLDLFDSIRKIFEKYGFTVTSILPGLALGGNLSVQPVLNQTIISTAMQKVNSLHQFDLLAQRAYKPESLDNNGNLEEEKTKLLPGKLKVDKRLLIMIGVFAFLLIFMVVLYFITYPPKPKTAPVQPPPAASINVSPTVEVSTVPSVTLAPVVLDVKNLTVQIISPSTSQNATQLRQQLEALGFKNITTQSQKSLGSASTIITFSDKVSADVKNAVITEVSKLSPNPSISVKPGGTSDISILLGQ